jgi:hypothetical protein
MKTWNTHWKPQFSFASTKAAAVAAAAASKQNERARLQTNLMTYDTGGLGFFAFGQETLDVDDSPVQLVFHPTLCFKEYVLCAANPFLTCNTNDSI